MALKQNVELLANYNQWMNEKLFNALDGFSDADLAVDRGAFFGSILGTLNHILVGDTIWLKRFSRHPSNFSALAYVDSLPSPLSLSETIYTNFCALKTARNNMDATIVAFALEASEQDYAYDLSYTNTQGQPFKKPFGFLVQHFYNHQTHHRGQLTTLLNQANIDVGVTDLLMTIPESEEL